MRIKLDIIKFNAKYLLKPLEEHFVCDRHAIDDRTLVRRIIMRLYGRWINDTLGFYLFLGKACKIPILGPVVKYFASQYGKYFHGGRVATIEECNHILDMATQISVVNCACREKVKGCNSPLETCIMVNTGAEVFSEIKNKEKISAGRAKDIIYNSGKQGLIRMVHHCIAPNTYSICNCCTCCCVPYKLKKEYGVDTAMVNGHYVAEIDFNKCKKCSKCVNACPEKAIDIKKGIIEFEKCLGCGLCIEQCGRGALQMAARDRDKKVDNANKAMGLAGKILMYTAFFLVILPLAAGYKVLNK